MTNEPSISNGKYKQVYYRANKFKPYTTSKIPYDDYLQTDVWRELRNKRLTIDFHRCRQCGTGINVEVHHIKYPDIWGTENVEDDLVTLCASCHARVHQNDNL